MTGICGVCGLPDDEVYYHATVSTLLICDPCWHHRFLACTWLDRWCRREIDPPAPTKQVIDRMCEDELP